MLMHCMLQSAMASGGNDIGNIDHSPEKMAHVLYGGMVGGPAKDDSFQDKRSNYKQSEVSSISTPKAKFLLSVILLCSAL